MLGRDHSMVPSAHVSCVNHGFAFSILSHDTLLRNTDKNNRFAIASLPHCFCIEIGSHLHRCRNCVNCIVNAMQSHSYSGTNAQFCMHCNQITISWQLCRNALLLKTMSTINTISMMMMIKHVLLETMLKKRLMMLSR